ncbi:MAG TPA: hypothetical protein VJ812_04415 [Gemmatimonadaceae bacterium]|nr:hypothetical protein [Gemmatimonadaceae bacterium]
MSAALVLVLAVAVAYLAAHVAFDWLARRFLIVSGAEYLLLGLLLGPHVSGVLSTQVIEGFAPLTTLALGWIGTIVGMQFYLPGLVRIPGLMYRLAFFEALLTLGVVAGLLWTLLYHAFRLPLEQSVPPAIALGAIAAVSAPAGIEMVARRLGTRGPMVRQLQLATAIDALVGVAAFGLLLAIRRPVEGASGIAITPTEWAVISIGIGVIGGALFHLFLGDETHIDRLFVALAGAVILTSGAAAYLHLSPLFTSMIVGMMLVNTSRNRDEINITLAHAERPFYFVILVFAGASWQPSISPWWIAPVILFLVARVVAKIYGARLGARVNGALPAVGPHWGRALLGQGGLALALALNYLQLEAAPLRNIVFTAAVASVLLTDVASARFTRSVLSPLVGGGDAARTETTESATVGTVEAAATAAREEGQ